MIDMLSNILWRIHILFILCFIISHFTQGLSGFIFVCVHRVNSKQTANDDLRWKPDEDLAFVISGWMKADGESWRFNLDEVSFSAIRTSNYFTGRENRCHTDHPFHHTLLFVYLNQSNRTLPQELAQRFFFFFALRTLQSFSTCDNCVFAISDRKKSFQSASAF